MTKPEVAMKVLFKYHSEAPLLPGYSRYQEVIAGEKHVGMIHLAHRDWRVADGTMPPAIELAIRPLMGKEAEEKTNAVRDVRSSKSAATGPAQKPEASKATASSRKSADERKASDRGRGKPDSRSKKKR